MIKRQHVVANFFASADAMRDSLDLRFKDPYTYKTSWDYFCDPKMYTYLRARAQEMVPAPLFMQFTQRLRQWCLDNLGLLPMRLPFLNLMVNGCRLGLHSDFHNGAWGYVYSLTRWQTRRFSGGETLLMRDGIPSYKQHHVHGEVLYELIPAHFNQLLIFDDRIVHGTTTIEGSMDPLDGRIALVGHIRATSPIVSGPLFDGDVRAVVRDALARIHDRTKAYREVQGTITCRLEVSPAGQVSTLTSLTDNLVTSATGYGPSNAVKSVRAEIQRTLAEAQFPTADSATSVVVAVLVPVPELTPIEFQVPHSSDWTAVRNRLERQFAQVGDLELCGCWEDNLFSVREPVSGDIRVEPNRISVRLDAPMWVPSQRGRFEKALNQWLATSAA